MKGDIIIENNIKVPQLVKKFPASWILPLHSLFKIHLKILPSNLCLGLSCGLFPSSHCSNTYYIFPIPCHMITLKLVGQEYKLWSS